MRGNNLLLDKMNFAVHNSHTRDLYRSNLLEFYKQRMENDDINSNKLTESFNLQQYAHAFKVHVRKTNLGQEYENHFIFKKNTITERDFC